MYQFYRLSCVFSQQYFFCICAFTTTKNITTHLIYCFFFFFLILNLERKSKSKMTSRVLELVQNTTRDYVALSNKVTINPNKDKLKWLQRIRGTPTPPPTKLQNVTLLWTLYLFIPSHLNTVNNKF